jgi:hypothetical protein
MVVLEKEPQKQPQRPQKTPLGSFEGMKRVFDPFNGEMHAESSPPLPPVHGELIEENDCDGVFEGTRPKNLGC